MAELKALAENEVEDMLLETGAIMEGHFLLTSGLHSPRYVEKFNVLQKPLYTEKLCQAMAAKFKDANIEPVVFFWPMKPARRWGPELFLPNGLMAR